MTIAVTGASGHIGANLVRELLRRGEDVRVLLRSASPASLEGLQIERHAGDVRDRGALDTLVHGATTVYHLAAIISIVGDPDGSVRAVNVDGTENVARACLAAGVGRMVHCCSVHAFDMRREGVALDESGPRVPDDPKRANAYDRSKAEGERRVRAVIAEGLDAVIVHPTGVIGPCDWEPSRMGQVFLGLQDRSLPSLVNGGFDFVDVRDVVQGMIAAAQRGRRNESYLLSGHYQRIPALAEIAEGLTGVRAPRFTSPMWMARLGAPFMQLLARIQGSEPLYTAESLDALCATNDLDNGKARRELGYDPRSTQESVRDVYRWFVDTGRLGGDTLRAELGE